MEHHYITDEIYDRLVAALIELAPKPSIHGGRDQLDADEIKTALGEIAGVWPEAIREDIPDQG